MLKRFGISILISAAIAWFIYDNLKYGHTDYPELGLSIILLVFCWLFWGIAVIAGFLYFLFRTYSGFLNAFVITANLFDGIAAGWLYGVHSPWFIWFSVTEIIMIGLLIVHRIESRRAQPVIPHGGGRRGWRGRL